MQYKDKYRAGTPETNDNNTESNTKQELQRLVTQSAISIDNSEEIPDHLQINAFTAQNNSFIDFRKHGSIRRVLHASQPRQKLDTVG